MGISAKDTKKLWGLAAGQCSYPGCGVVCMDSNGLSVIGEMAHVIAKKPTGPRGLPEGGEDSYNNLILLCPTHHRKIDKSPEGTFTKDVLLEWKKNHEANVAAALASPTFKTMNEVAEYIKKLLIENRATWETYGPESAEAAVNPYSSLAQLWTARKLDTIIPNNTRIINAITRNKSLFDGKAYEAARAFVEHAKGFERSCYNRSEGIPRFPQQFDRMVTFYAEE